MAASMKEKNMPNIPSNLYGGLQKWVNRASLSLRERKRSRRNSDVCQTMYKPNPPEINGYHHDDCNPPKLVPVHVRSRSTPVMMPEPQSYLNNIERSNRKTSESPKTEHQKEALLEPRRRQESKDDTNGGSYKERKITVGSRSLSRTCSKSESSLIDACWSSDAERGKSQTTPKYRVRRTSSQDTEESIGGSTSDFDINYNINKKSRSSRASSKTNKRERAQSIGSKGDSNGSIKLNEKLRNSSSYDKITKDVQSRLDRWVERTTGFEDSRQSSFESTSSSEEMFDIIAFGKAKRKTVSNETRELRKLQTALEELVSSCGRSSSQKSSDGEHTGESVEATNTRASRKVSLQDTGAMFSKAIEMDNHCPQSVRQSDYRSIKCGSSSGSNSYSGGGSIVDDVIEEKHEELNSELEESYDSVDGKVLGSGGIRDGVHVISEIVESDDTQNSLSCVSDIGRRSGGTRALGHKDSTAPESLESDMNTKNNERDSLSKSRCQNKDEDECQHESQQSKYFDREDNCCSSDETKQTEGNELICKQNPVGGGKDEHVETNLPRLHKSSKNYRAPPPPPSDAKETPVRQSNKSSDLNFNDDDLSAFAAECLRHAEKKKTPGKEREKESKRESKSDSEEEKRNLEIDFIYIRNGTQVKDNVHSYPEQIHRKSSTHPQTAFDENPLYFITSDDDMERSGGQSNERLREKRNSVDSLDGRVLFGLEPNYNFNSQNLQNVPNEDDRSSDGLQTEEDHATESPGKGLRKFPSLPLFYIPKEFDQQRSGDFKNTKSSFRKSIWKRIKSLPRPENHRVNQSTKSKKLETSSSQIIDPFYHGEKEDQDLMPATREKAWTLSTTKISRPASQRRPSLEARRSAPVLKVHKTVKEAERLNEYVVIPPAKTDESQC
jgi:hypothetical protein